MNKLAFFADKCKSFIQDLPEALFLEDLEGNILDVNQEACEMLGYEKEELLDMEVEDLVPEDAPAFLPNQIEEASRTERPLVTINVREDGTEIPVELRGKITEVEGEERMLISVRDIAEYKEAEEELEESEEKYRTIFESAKDAIFIMKEDRFVDCNEKTLEMFECEREDIVGQPPYEFSPEKQPDGKASAEKAKEKINSALEGDPQNFEWVHTTKDGEPFPTEVTLNRYMIEDEKFVMAIVRDVTERKKAEEELRENEKEFRQIFNNANDAMYLHEITDEGMPGQFLEVNDVACEMLGYHREELLSMTPQDLDAGRKAQEVPNIMEDLLAEGHKTFEMHHEAKDGQLVPVEVSAHIFETNGERRILSIARDISERKELQRRQDLFSSSLEQASLGVYWVKPDGSFAYTNEKVKGMLGYSEKELTEMYVWDVDPNQDHVEDKRKEKWTELKEKGTLNFESVHQTKDGDKFPVEITSTYIQHGGEEYEIVFSKDITERKKAEAELEKSESKFRAISERVHDGLFIRSGDKFEWVNKRMTEILGYSKEELYGKSIWNILHSEDRGRVKEIAKKRATGKEVPSTYEVRVLTKDGEVRDAKLAISTIEYKGEQVTLGSAKDITERKEAERKVEKRAKHERLLRQQSARFLKCQGGDLDTAIDDGLTEIGEFLDVDRTYLFQFDWEKEVMSNTHEWCGEGIEPQIDNLQDIPNSSLPAWMDKLQSLEAIHIPSVPDLPDSWEAEREILEAQNIQSLVVVPVSYNQNLLGFAGFDAVREKREWNSEEMDLLRVFGDLTGSALHLHDTEEKLREDEQQLRRSFIQLAETTSRVLGVRDPYTQEHEQRVAKLAREVGKRMGLDEDTLLGLYIGGLLHDIGKITISESVLSKPGELKDVEWQMIKSHPEVGYNQILEDTDFPWPAAEMTLDHHERLDGSGYPDGLEGEELSLEVRILGAVDVVEAMSTRRPYREARSKEQTLEVIKDGKGDKFDPEVVDILVEIIEEGEIEFGGD